MTVASSQHYLNCYSAINTKVVGLVSDLCVSYKWLSWVCVCLSVVVCWPRVLGCAVVGTTTTTTTTHVPASTYIIKHVIKMGRYSHQVYSISFFDASWWEIMLCFLQVSSVMEGGDTQVLREGLKEH